MSALDIGADRKLREQNEKLQERLEQEKNAHEVTRKELETRSKALQSTEALMEDDRQEYNARLQRLDEDALKKARHLSDAEVAYMMAKAQQSYENANKREQEGAAYAEALIGERSQIAVLNRTQKYETAEYLSQESTKLNRQHKQELAAHIDRAEGIIAEKVGEEMRSMQKAGEARRHERSSYAAYRLVWRDLDRDVRVLNEHLSSVQTLLDKMALLWERDLHQYNPVKIEPWFPHRYPSIAKEIRHMLKGKQQGAEQSARTMNDIIMGSNQVENDVRMRGHRARTLFRHHRFEEDYIGTRAVALCSEYLNETPLAEERERLERDIRQLRDKVEFASIGRDRAQLQSRIARLEKDRLLAVRLLAYFSDVRHAKTLEVVAQSPLSVQELYVRPLSVRQLLSQADFAWHRYTREPEYANSSASSDRMAFLETRTELKSEVREFERFIRMRQLLQESLRQPASERNAFAQQLKQQIAEMELSGQSQLRQVLSLGREGVAKSLTPSRLPVASVAAGDPAQSQANTPQQISEAHIERAKDTTRKLASTISNPARKQLMRDLKTHNKRHPAWQQQRREEKAQLRTKPKPPRNETEPTEKSAATRQDGSDGDVSDVKQRLSKNDQATLVKFRRFARRGFPSQVHLEMLPEDTKLDVQNKSSDRAQQTSTTGAAVVFKPTERRQAAHSHGPDLWKKLYRRQSQVDVKRAASASISDHRLLAAIDGPPVHTDKAGVMRAQAGQPHVSEALRCSDTSFSHEKQFSTPRLANGYQCSDESGKLTQATESSATASSSQASYQPSEQPDLTPASRAITPSDDDTDTAVINELPQLTYHMSDTDRRNAAIASANSASSYWSHKLYANSGGDKPLVYYCTDLDKAETRAKEFVGEPVVGFDIEWEVGQTSGKSSIKKNVSLIQIAAEDKIALFHIALFKGESIHELMPPSLRDILESRDVVKTGVNIQGDARRLDQYFGVTMSGIFELSHLYRVVMFSETPNQINRKPFKLADQVQTVLLLPLKKDAVRTSAWSKKLDMQQTDYAAADAYAGFRLFHALEAKRKAMDPTPPRPAFWEDHKPIQLGDGTLIEAKTRRKTAPAGLAKPVDAEDNDEDEEFFDAVETLSADQLDADAPQSAGVPLLGISITYPTLPSLPDQLETRMAELDVAGHDGGPRPLAKSNRQGPPPSDEVARAERWVGDWRTSLPSGYAVKARHVHLRAYHLWHEQGFDCDRIAAILRDPPLALQTVATYVLDAVKLEALEHDGPRIRGVLGILPQSAQYRYAKIADETKR